jgi:hypothetical protein
MGSVGVSLRVALATGLALAIVTSASAMPAAANVAVQIGVASGSDVSRQPPAIPSGGTANVTGLNFVAGPLLNSTGPDPAAVKVGFALPPGLHWGADGPDAGEECTASEQTTCETTVPGDGVTTGWGWNVTAEKPGMYTLNAQIIESSTTDSDASNNTTSITVNVTEAVVVSASAVKLSPLKPKAGAAVTATVRVVAGGVPIRPSAVRCTGVAGVAKLRGTPRATVGSASCAYRPPKTARGKRLSGAIELIARGEPFTKRFSAKLR